MRRFTILIGAVVVVGCAVLGIVAAVVALRGDDEESRTRAFFTLPTPSSCADSDLQVSIDDSHFSAFVPGSRLGSTQGRFLLVKFTASGTALPPATELAGRFILAEASGRRYTPVDESHGATPETGTSPRQQQLIFDVPQALSAAKLMFDDGCVHQEWISP